MRMLFNSFVNEKVEELKDQMRALLEQATEEVVANVKDYSKAVSKTTASKEDVATANKLANLPNLQNRVKKQLAQEMALFFDLDKDFQ